MVGNWAWQSFHKPTPQSSAAPQTPQSAGASSSGSSTEEPVTEKGSTTSPEEIFVPEEEPQEYAQASTQGFTESPEVVVDMTPAAVAPVPEAPAVALAVNTTPSEIVPPPISNTSPLPAPGPPPAPSPPTTVGNEAINQAGEVPSTTAQVPLSPPPLATISQPQMLGPTNLEEPVPFTEQQQASFENEPPLGEAAYQQIPFEGTALEAGTRTNVSATAGDTVATASRGAIAISGSATARAG